MRFVQFDAVEIQADEANGTARVIQYEVNVNPDLVCAIIPTIVPSELAGAGGRPMPKRASRILFGAMSVTVTTEVEETRNRLINGTPAIPAKAPVAKDSDGPQIIGIRE